MKKVLFSLVAMLLLSVSGIAQTALTFTKVNSASELEAGTSYLIVGYDDNLGYCAMIGVNIRQVHNRVLPVGHDGHNAPYPCS